MIYKNKIVMPLLAFAALAISLTAVILETNKQEGQTVASVRKNIIQNKISIEGMTCEACEATIEKRVAKIKGVQSVKASHANKQALISFDKAETSVQTLIEAIKDTGYKVLSYEDENGSHLLHEEKTAEVLMKCGAGKCGGANKCGSGR